MTGCYQPDFYARRAKIELSDLQEHFNIIKYDIPEEKVNFYELFHNYLSYTNLYPEGQSWRKIPVGTGSAQGTIPTAPVRCEPGFGRTRAVGTAA
jgi:hypothetical protein